MLKVYVAPSGSTFQFEEGTQPEGYVLLNPEPEKKPAPRKRRTTANKARTAKDKEA